MKRFHLAVCAAGYLIAFNGYSQNVGIGTNTPTEKLHVQGGARITSLSGTGYRLVQADGNGVLSTIIDGTAGQILTTNGAGVLSWGTANAGWELLGNAGTNPTINFVGTTDVQALVFRTNSTEAARIFTNQNMSIGTTSDLARLGVEVPASNSTESIGFMNRHEGSYTGITYAMRNYNNSSTDATKYGIYNYTSADGTGIRYGIYNYTYLNPASTASAYGFRNYVSVNGSSSAGSQYGIYNYITSSAGTGSHYGQVNYVYLPATSVADNYGEYTYMDYSSGNRYGEYKAMNTTSTYVGDVYGDYNHIYGSGTASDHGVYNSMESSGAASQYGVYTDYTLSVSTGTKCGVRNEFGDVDGTKYGMYNSFPSGTATGTIYGVYNRIESDGNATKYGTYNYVSGGEGALRGSYNYVNPAATNTNTIYGVYGYVGSSGTGTHYGGYFYGYGDGNFAVYGTNSHNTGWAGYFVGNFYADGNSIINESGTADHDFRVESDTRTHAMWVDADENLTRFGTSNIGSDYQNGTTVAGMTVDYLGDFDNGIATGTAIGIGSVEYLLDNASETMINNRFSPTTDDLYDLGSATYRWDDVYATNGTIVTSDEREKTNIQPMTYGLAEIMALRPVTYKWKRTQRGNTVVSDDQKELKLGLIAQEVQQVVPEVVQTHDWRVVDEDHPNDYHLVPMDRLGMSYHELVPVLIKATQEQQGIIEGLKSTVESQNDKIDALEREIQEIKKLIGQ